ncbi:MAG: hypothetical protein RLZZ428_745 [Pseudomonadota bacterium]|jgi:hypothetical protein
MVELYVLIPLCLIVLIVVVGGYVYMFLHVMRSDPRELEFRETLGQDTKLVPRAYPPKRK